MRSLSADVVRRRQGLSVAASPRRGLRGRRWQLIPRGAEPRWRRGGRRFCRHAAGEETQRRLAVPLFECRLAFEDGAQSPAGMILASLQTNNVLRDLIGEYRNVFPVSDNRADKRKPRMVRLRRLGERRARKRRRGNCRRDWPTRRRKQRPFSCDRQDAERDRPKRIASECGRSRFVRIYSLRQTRVQRRNPGGCVVQRSGGGPRGTRYKTAQCGKREQPGQTAPPKRKSPPLRQSFPHYSHYQSFPHYRLHYPDDSAKPPQALSKAFSAVLGNA
jgi:hypothetical protein